MGAASAADPVTPKPAEDPCDTQPGVGLSAFLLANATTALEAPLLDCFVPRNFRMRDLFPSRVIAEDEQRSDGFLAKFLDALDPQVNAMFNRVDCFPTIIDPTRCPSQLLDHLLYHLGNPFTLEEGLTDPEKRRLAIVLFAAYALKGTCPGLIGIVRTLHGVSVTECIQPNIDCWELDVDELDLTTVLCPSTPFENRSFSVMVNINLTDRQRRQIRNIIDWGKPAGTHFIGFIEPGNDTHVDHWELDFSDLDRNTDLH